MSFSYRRTGRYVVTAVKALCVLHLVAELGVFPYPASGPSMLPTFAVEGEGIVVSMWHRRGRGIAVGDIVAYKIPINDTFGAKRVLGMPGDYVVLRPPATLADHGSASSSSSSSSSSLPLSHRDGQPHHHDQTGRGEDVMIQVPEGHCWIVGDNLTASRDSRDFGPLPLGLIKGKVIAKYRPPFGAFATLPSGLTARDAD